MPPSESSAFAYWILGWLSNSGLKRQRRPKKLEKSPRPLRKLHIAVERRRHNAFLRKLRRVHRYIGPKDFTKEDTEERYNEVILVMHYFGWLLRVRIFNDDNFEPFAEIEIRGGNHVLIKGMRTERPAYEAYKIVISSGARFRPLTTKTCATSDNNLVRFVCRPPNYVVQDGFNDDGTTWMEQSVKVAVRYGVKVTIHIIKMFMGFDLLMHSFKDLMKNVIALNNAHF